MAKRYFTMRDSACVNICPDQKVNIPEIEKKVGINNNVYIGSQECVLNCEFYIHCGEDEKGLWIDCAKED